MHEASGSFGPEASPSAPAREDSAAPSFLPVPARARHDGWTRGRLRGRGWLSRHPVAARARAVESSSGYQLHQLNNLFDGGAKPTGWLDAQPNPIEAASAPPLAALESRRVCDLSVTFAKPPQGNEPLAMQALAALRVGAGRPTGGSADRIDVPGRPLAHPPPRHACPARSRRAASTALRPGRATTPAEERSPGPTSKEKKR